MCSPDQSVLCSSVQIRLLFYVLTGVSCCIGPAFVISCVCVFHLGFRVTVNAAGIFLLHRSWVSIKKSFIKSFTFLDFFGKTAFECNTLKRITI